MYTHKQFELRYSEDCNGTDDQEWFRRSTGVKKKGELSLFCLSKDICLSPNCEYLLLPFIENADGPRYGGLRKEDEGQQDGCIIDLVVFYDVLTLLSAFAEFHPLPYIQFKSKDDKLVSDMIEVLWNGLKNSTPVVQTLARMKKYSSQRDECLKLVEQERLPKFFAHFVTIRRLRLIEIFELQWSQIYALQEANVTGLFDLPWSEIHALQAANVTGQTEGGDKQTKGGDKQTKGGDKHVHQLRF